MILYRVENILINRVSWMLNIHSDTDRLFSHNVITYHPIPMVTTELFIWKNIR